MYDIDALRQEVIHLRDKEYKNIKNNLQSVMRKSESLRRNDLKTNKVKTSGVIVI